MTTLISKENLIKAILLMIMVNIALYFEIRSLDTQTSSEIIFLDVGQGDAILIKSKNTLGLIDTGPNNSVLSLLSKYIPMSITKLDFILLTHLDKDHIEAFLRLSDLYQIDKIFIPEDEKSNFLIKEIMQIINSKNIPLYYTNTDTDFRIGELEVNIVWPKPKNGENNKDSNDLSIGVEIIKGACNIYSAGDLSAKFETESLKYLHNMNIEILKVGHHGSKTSTSGTFLGQIKPQIGVISAGKDNRYGHPNKDVMNLLKSFNISIFETKNSDIIVRFNQANTLDLHQNKDSLKVSCI